MSVLTYRCPNTANDVTTSIETDALTLTRLRDLKVAVACPHCVGGHMLPANQLYLGQLPERTPASPAFSVRA